MVHPVLMRLACDDFADSLGVVPSSRAMVYLLRTHPDVHTISEALGRECIFHEQIRGFVGDLPSSMRPGQSFDPQVPLAALAVVLKSSGTSFAAEPIRDFARLKIVELREAAHAALPVHQKQAALE